MLYKIKEEIDKAQNIVIAGHVNPDGDAIGASISLCEIIKQYDKNKNVRVCFTDELPKYTKELLDGIVIEKNIEDEIDLLIAVDTANIERLAVTKEMIKKAKRTVCIDHHISNKGYFDINYVKDISSASEMVYDFIDVLNININEKIARFIYLGIINDTGNFKHPNVKSNTFLIASDLMKTGINASKISKTLFSKSYKKAKILANAVLEQEYIEELKLSYYYINQEKMKKCGITRDDTDGISEYLFTIKENEITLFLREEIDGQIKGSFRSEKVDVNKIASYFNGGGHKNAAGFKTNLKVDEIIQKVKELLS